MKITPSQVNKIFLVCCGQGFNKEYQGHYNRYKVLINSKPIQDLFSEKELKELAYWNNRSKVMTMTIWGSSQLFEAQISLGRFFGWNSKNWSKFSKLVSDIKEI